MTKRPIWPLLQKHLTPWRSCLLAIVCFEVLWLTVPPSGAFVERWYSQGLFRVIMATMSALQNASPVSLTSILLTVLLLVLGTLSVRTWKRLRKSGGTRWRIVPWILGVLFQSTIILLLWMLFLWGAGYQRDPVSDRWALDITTLSDVEHETLKEELLSVIKTNMDAASSTDTQEAIAAISQSMERLVVARGERSIQLPRQVRATPPGLFLINASGGMCVPMAVEPFVDGAYDPVSFTQVAAHELGHVAGYNRESEATLMGYLAGLHADNPLARYAVALDIYMDLIRRVPTKERYEAAWNALPQVARDDVTLGREIASRYQIRVAILNRLRYHMYDTYLKSQGIEEGMVNYSVGLRLFAGAWRQGLDDRVAAMPIPSEETAP